MMGVSLILIVTYFIKGEKYPLVSRDELLEQITSL